MRAVLVGNQNCGKTTLFNLLTGSSQKIGNWPGVTVSKKSGVIDELDMELIDLPGTYSLVPYSLEEKITCGFLMNEDYDLIINVVDVTTLERGLFLTSELLDLNKNVVVIFNMMDKLKDKGLSIDIDGMRKNLGIDICMISATRGNGILPLLKIIKKNIAFKSETEKTNLKVWNNFDNEKKIKYRYDYIDNICRKNVKHIKKPKSISGFLDSIFLNKFLAIPIFVLIMFSMYYISIEVFGKFFSDYLAIGIRFLKLWTFDMLSSANVSEWIISLICNGIIIGVGSVLSFLPQLFIIFIVTSFLEACGYMARVSFVFDKILKKIGLNGKSLIAFILGVGCSVSGIMATKIIENESERKSSIMLTPFIPCSAKLPLITLFTSYFFPNNGALIATSFYVLSVLIIIVSSLIIKKIFCKNDNELYVFELPDYQMPKLKFIFKDVRIKILDFVKKVGTTIFVASIIVWLLISFSLNFEYGVEPNQSVLAFLGQKISWIFVPIFKVDSWELTVSAIQGLIAKEQVISSMEIITGISSEFPNMYEIFNVASPFGFFTPVTAYAFVALNLFTVPCIAAVISMAREFNKISTLCFTLLYQFFTGWSIAFCISNLMMLS